MRLFLLFLWLAHFNPAVTQATIGQTICVKGYSASVRPSTSYTRPIKLALIAALPPTASHSPADYELDHEVAIEDGGHPTNSVNLILQLWPEARAKDVVENRVRRLICSGQITLMAGRQCLVTDWRRCP